MRRDDIVMIAAVAVALFFALKQTRSSTPGVVAGMQNFTDMSSRNLDPGNASIYGGAGTGSSGGGNSGSGGGTKSSGSGSGNGDLWTSLASYFA